MEDNSVVQLKGLIAKKEKIEEDLKDFQEVLESNNVGMKEDLVDKDGYPRADIDVYSVRTARNKIICLRNDLSSIMKEIEEGLHKVHAMARENPKESNVEDMDTSPDLEMHPFLSVDLISRESPAEKAGLTLGDQILKFGTITSKNFNGLASIGSLVQHSKGKPVPIVINREGSIKNITLTPNTWEGRGLLG
eukprot:gene16547-7971_t